MNNLYSDTTLFRLGLHRVLREELNDWGLNGTGAHSGAFGLTLGDACVMDVDASLGDNYTAYPLDPWSRRHSWEELEYENARLVRAWIHSNGGITHEACGGVYMTAYGLDNEVFWPIEPEPHGLKVAYLSLAMIAIGALYVTSALSDGSDD